MKPGTLHIVRTQVPDPALVEPDDLVVYTRESAVSHLGTRAHGPVWTDRDDQPSTHDHRERPTIDSRTLCELIFEHARVVVW